MNISIFSMINCLKALNCQVQQNCSMMTWNSNTYTFCCFKRWYYDAWIITSTYDIWIIHSVCDTTHWSNVIPVRHKFSLENNRNENIFHTNKWQTKIRGFVVSLCLKKTNFQPVFESDRKCLVFSHLLYLNPCIKCKIIFTIFYVSSVTFSSPKL